MPEWHRLSWSPPSSASAVAANAPEHMLACAGGLLVSSLQLAFGEFDAPAQTASSAVRLSSNSDAVLDTAKRAATQAVDPGGPPQQSQQGDGSPVHLCK